MEKITISKGQARRLLLSIQHLYPPYKLKGKQGIVDYIHQVGCIQFDPLDIVGHNHELVLQSRLHGFKPEMLDELLYKDRKLLDGWDKNMSIYSVEDWQYFKRYRDAYLKDLGDSSRPVVSVLPEVRKELEKRGPLSSIDLKFNETVDWPWAPTRMSRAALESMYFWGELIIHHKVHTRKVYDFAGKHIPPKILHAPDPNVIEEQFYDWQILRRIGGVGLMWNKPGDSWLGIHGLKSSGRVAAFERLMKQARIIEVNVEGMDIPLYMRSEDKNYLQILNLGKVLSHASIMAPLDNLLWDRKLIKELFNFEYRWEVYKPVNERRYGYYVLPVLYGDKFVARFEPGWDKKGSTLIIKNWWWEEGIKQTERMKSELSKCFNKFVSYLKADTIRIDDSIREKADIDWVEFSR